MHAIRREDEVDGITRMIFLARWHARNEEFPAATHMQQRLCTEQFDDLDRATRGDVDVLREQHRSVMDGFGTNTENDFLLPAARRTSACGCGTSMRMLSLEAKRRPSFSMSSTGKKFMGGLPMKPATNWLTGCW